MTSAQAPSRLYIPQAFASATGASLTPIEAVASNNVNFADGFPSSYEAPSSSSGKFVTRGEINAIGNLASVNEFARACGGIVTFDPRLAVKIGGYPRGAVLEYLQGINYSRVVSLVDDNLVDFTGESTSLDTATGSPSAYATNTAYAKGAYVKKTDVTPVLYYVVTDTITSDENTGWAAVASKMALLQDIVSGSVDGVNWAFCEQGTIPDYNVLMEIKDFNCGHKEGDEYDGNNIPHEAFPLGIFIAPRNGTISFVGTCDIELIPFPYTTALEEEYTDYGGMAVVILPYTADMDGPLSQQYKQIYYKGNLHMIATTTGGERIYYYNNDATEPFAVTRGTKYCVYILNQLCNFTNSTLKMTIV